MQRTFFLGPGQNEHAANTRKRTEKANRYKQTQNTKRRTAERGVQLAAGRDIRRGGEAREASGEERTRNGRPASRSYGRGFDLEKKK